MLNQASPPVNAAGEWQNSPLALKAAKTAEADSERSLILSMPQPRPVEGRAFVVRWIEYLSYAIAWLTSIVGFILSVGIFVCILVQIFFRYVLNAPLAWTDETAIFLFAWTMLLFASLNVRDRTHVRFSIIIKALPKSVSQPLDAAIMILIAIFGTGLIYVSGELIDLVWGNLSPAVNYPLQALYIAVPVHGVFVVIHALANILLKPAASIKEAH